VHSSASGSIEDVTRVGGNGANLLHETQVRGADDPECGAHPENGQMETGTESPAHLYVRWDLPAVSGGET
jgi:hypothetical protein